MQLSLFLLTLMGQCCLIKCHLYEYIYIKDKMTWSEAQRYCRKNYTDLATVSNMTDMARLHESISTEDEGSWIGLHNPQDENRTWHWSLPGVEFNNSETNWGENEASDTESENCGFINKHLNWGDDPCEEKKTFFLCYDENNTIKKFHLIEENKNWREAQRHCRESHTDLASGPQQLQDNELVTLVNISSRHVIFVGMFRDAWRWSDGSSFSFRHWSDQENVDQSSSNSKRCAATFGNSERWKSCKCDECKPFFCYDDKVILIRKRMNWEDALYYCREHHHDLVSITSLDEQRWVQEKAKNATTPHVWTGLRYTCTLDFWFWVSDEAVSYKNWASGQDGNDCDMSGAMETGGRHQWVKINDNEKMNFICSTS